MHRCSRPPTAPAGSARRTTCAPTAPNGRIGRRPTARRTASSSVVGTGSSAAIPTCWRAWTRWRRPTGTSAGPRSTSGAARRSCRTRSSRTSMRSTPSISRSRAVLARSSARVPCAPDLGARTMRDWLLASFGPTLCDAFFFPFHERYTAGLYERIAPQDADKSPTPAAHREWERRVQPVVRVPAPGARRAGARDGRRVRRPVRAPRRRRSIRRRARSGSPTDRASATPTSCRRCRWSTWCASPASTWKESPTRTRRCSCSTSAPSRVLATRTRTGSTSRTRTSGHHRIGFYSNVDAAFLPGSARRARATGRGLRRARVPRR